VSTASPYPNDTVYVILVPHGKSSYLQPKPEFTVDNRAETQYLVVPLQTHRSNLCDVVYI